MNYEAFMKDAAGFKTVGKKLLNNTIQNIMIQYATRGIKAFGQLELGTVNTRQLKQKCNVRRGIYVI